MKRSELKNLFNKNINQKNWCKHKIQQNYCVNFLYKTTKQYYKNIIKMTQIQKKSCC